MTWFIFLYLFDYTCWALYDHPYGLFGFSSTSGSSGLIKIDQKSGQEEIWVPVTTEIHNNQIARIHPTFKNYYQLSISDTGSKEWAVIYGYDISVNGSLLSKTFIFRPSAVCKNIRGVPHDWTTFELETNGAPSFVVIAQVPNTNDNSLMIIAQISIDGSSTCIGSFSVNDQFGHQANIALGSSDSDIYLSLENSVVHINLETKLVVSQIRFNPVNGSKKDVLYRLHYYHPDNVLYGFYSKQTNKNGLIDFGVAYFDIDGSKLVRVADIKSTSCSHMSIASNDIFIDAFDYANGQLITIATCIPIHAQKKKYGWSETNSNLLRNGDTILQYVTVNIQNGNVLYQPACMDKECAIAMDFLPNVFEDGKIF